MFRGLMTRLLTKNLYLEALDRLQWLRKFEYAPFADVPTLTASDYFDLAKNASVRVFPEIDSFEEKYGFRIDKDWLDELALHTVVGVQKKGQINYTNGRVLYAAIRQYLESTNGPITILESGTSRGFSAICMARAVNDSSKNARILTIDPLPVKRDIFWNCIDDLEGKKTRLELLNRYAQYLQYIIFFEGKTVELSRFEIPRIGFAFLDGAHTYHNVMEEVCYVSERQQKNDVILFDDVTPGYYKGVAKAVKETETSFPYTVSYFSSEESRGFALAVHD